MASSDESEPEIPGQRLLFSSSSDSSLPPSPLPERRMTTPLSRRSNVMSMTPRERFNFIMKKRIEMTLLKEMGFLVKARHEVEPAPGAPAEIVVVRFHEGYLPPSVRRDPQEPAPCYKAVFTRQAHAANERPWRLSDWRLPLGVRVEEQPPGAMRSLEESSCWLRAARAALRAHWSRLRTFAELRADRHLCTDPDTQVFSIGSVFLRWNLQFIPQAGSTLDHSVYNLCLMVWWAGDTSVLPQTVKVYCGSPINQRITEFETQLKHVGESVLHECEVTTSSSSFESPLLKLFLGWRENLEAVIRFTENI